MNITQKDDITVLLNQKRIACSTPIFGFESYTIEISENKRVRVLHPNVPVTFEPSMMQDGHPVAKVSDTPNNRKILQELSDRNILTIVTRGIVKDDTNEEAIPDSEVGIKEEGSAVEVTAEYLEGLTGDEFKREISRLSKELNVKIPKGTTKAQAIELVLGK